MSEPNRRIFFVLAASSVAITGTGCSKEDIDKKVAETSTGNLETAKVLLHGYQLVSMKIGNRIVGLSPSAIRILGVLIIASSIAAKLSVEYIDDELIRRKIEEELSGEERQKIEMDGTVAFQTESGVTEAVRIGLTVYEEPESEKPSSY